MLDGAHSIDRIDRQLYWGNKLWDDANPWQRGHTLLRARSFFLVNICLRSDCNLLISDLSTTLYGMQQHLQVKEKSPEIEQEASLSKFSPRTRRAARSVRVWV